MAWPATHWCMIASALPLAKETVKLLLLLGGSCSLPLAHARDLPLHLFLQRRVHLRNLPVQYRRLSMRRVHSSHRVLPCHSISNRCQPTPVALLRLVEVAQHAAHRGLPE